MTHPSTPSDAASRRAAIADQWREAWRRASLKDLRTAFQASQAECERLEAENAFVISEFKEVCLRLRSSVERYKLGLGGEKLDVLVCDELARLRAADEALKPSTSSRDPVDDAIKRGDRARGYFAPLWWVLVAIPVETVAWLRFRFREWRGR